MKVKLYQEVLNSYLEDTPSAFETGGVRKITSSRYPNHMGLCPFHNDRNPSFSFNAESGLWKCFAGCGHGNLFDFYGKILGIDPKQDFRKLIETMYYLKG
jgi:DNA primase